MGDPDDHVAVSLAIEVGTEPIAGVVTVGDGRPRDFRTWLELISALDEARATDKGDDR
jgi:hypothetical protein